ncbi:MAG: peptide chain release factor N(5)-glutamine methyltransferase [Prolixibacteraceae bacterium]|nr:peptide chain release factor N(5)-glutamine methyltransferase [Prolixibacteraceae bacterium]
MQSCLKYIRNELSDLYSKNETEGLIRYIFEYIKKYSVSDLIIHDRDKLSDKERNMVKKIVSELKSHKPIQYILNETEFYGLPFKVNNNVLIPRPETEELVDWIVKENIDFKGSVLDVGTGSGCIAVSLKKKLKDSDVYGIDISEKALIVAQSNALLNEVNVSFIKKDILNISNYDSLPKFDIIVSNPPYVTEKEKDKMQDNVLKYEPFSALFVPDDDPLKFYRALADTGQKKLNENGKIFWEINENYGKDCMRLLEKFHFYNIRLRKDIRGKDRMISAEYKE